MGHLGPLQVIKIHQLFEWAGLGESRGGVVGLIKCMRAVQVVN